MQNKVSFGFFIFCVALIVACQNDVSPPKEDGEPTTSIAVEEIYYVDLEGDTAIYETQLAFKLEDESADPNKEGVTKIVFRYPLVDSFRSKIVQDSINTIILDLVLQDAAGIQAHETIEACLNEFIQDYRVHRKEMQKVRLPYSSSWLFDLNISLLLNAPNLMTLKVHQVEFTGGAHANPWTSYVNIDLRSGKILNLDDLLIGDYESELLMIAESYFKRSRNLAPDTNLVQTNYEFSTGDFTLPENFSLGKKGLSFHYNHYDLGPYSMGIISFEIPYHKMLSMLNREILDLVAVDH